MMSLYTTLVAAIWLTILTITSAHNIVKVNDQVALEVVSSEIVRVFRCDQGCNASGAIRDRRSLVVLDEARDPSVRYDVSILDDTLTVHTDLLQAEASRSLGTVHFSHRGQTLSRGKSWSIDTNGVSQEWELQPFEAIYGGGQYVNGLLNYRSAPIRMEQFNTEAAVPFVLSSHNYGVLWIFMGKP
jgi:alpha-D-xyloside xylohydrolase